MTSGVEDTNLRAPQRISIVEGCYLPSSHFSGSYIQHTAQLHAFVHSLGQVCDGTDLRTIEVATRSVGECRQLQPLATIGSHRRDSTYLHTLRRVLNADDSYGRGCADKVLIPVVNKNKAKKHLIKLLIIFLF